MRKPMQIGSQQEAKVVADGDNNQQASRAPWFIAGAALFALVGIAFVSLWTAGSGEQNFAVWDTCFWLNSGWRILHGQVPHSDFSLTTGTPLGYLTALGMKLKGACVGSIAAGQAVLGALLAIASFAVLRRRTSPALALAASLFCALLVMATRQAGEAYDIRSHAFLYNRIAEGFLALFAWIVLMPPDRPTRIRTGIELVAAGLLLALLTLTKFTYGLAALVVLCVAACWGVLSAGRGAAYAVSFCVAVAGFRLGLGLNFADWFHDIIIPLHIGYNETQNIRLIPSAIKGLSGLVVLAGLWMLWRTGQSRWRARFSGAGVCALWLLSIFIMLATQQRQEYPLVGTSAFALYAFVRRQVAGRPAEKRAALVLLAVVVLPQLVPDARSIHASWRSAQQEPHPACRIAASPMSDLRLAPGFSGIADQLNDGLAIVRSHVPIDSAVMCFDYADPFSFALQRPPARGGAVFWYPDFSFDPDHHPPPESVFRDRPWVLTAQQTRYRIPILHIYGPWMERHYRSVAESRHYRLWAPQPQE